MCEKPQFPEVFSIPSRTERQEDSFRKCETVGKTGSERGNRDGNVPSEFSLTLTDESATRMNTPKKAPLFVLIAAEIIFPGCSNRQKGHPITPVPAGMISPSETYSPTGAETRLRKTFSLDIPYAWNHAKVYLGDQYESVYLYDLLRAYQFDSVISKATAGPRLAPH